MSAAKRYTYACTDVNYRRKDKPDAWITTDQVNGQMFVGYPSFSFIPGSQGDAEPIRYGDFVVDIDTGKLACGDAVKILDWFDRIYSIGPDQWRIYLSGKKGIHLELPAEILGTDAGNPYLTLGYKRLALEIEGELGIKLDSSMYNMGTGKPYRQPNVMRDTGTVKRQIEYSDLAEITSEEEYRDACKEPGPTWQPTDTSQNVMLAAKMEQYLADAEKHRESVKAAPPLTEEETNRLAKNTPPCIHILANLTKTTKGNTFNDIAVQLTAYAISAGLTEGEFLELCKTFIENYPSSSLDTLPKRYENCTARYRTMAANGNQHSCGGILAMRIPGYECGFCSLGQPAADNQDQEPESVTPEKLMEVFEVKKDYVSRLGKEEFLFPNLLLSNHVATIIAMAGGGKTTIFYFHIAPLLASQGLKVWYIDADSPASDHKRMKEIADNHGFKFLNPDANPGTTMEGLIGTLRTIANSHNDLSGWVFIFDTLKKAADLMSKGSVKAFYQLARKLANLGATVVLLGHANKYRDRDGNLIFEGVGDIRSDSDELIFFERKAGSFEGIDITTIVDPDKGAKVRGIFQPISFHISTDRIVTQYEKPLPVVDFTATAAEKSTDDEIVKAAVAYLTERGGPVIQSQVVQHTADITASGLKRVRQLIVQHSELRDAPTRKWMPIVYSIGEKNAHMLELPGQENPVWQS